MKKIDRIWQEIGIAANWLRKHAAIHKSHCSKALLQKSLEAERVTVLYISVFFSYTTV